MKDERRRSGVSETVERATTADVASYRRGRVPRQVRLAHVLGLAEELFAERGYSAASMDELARRADVSKPMVYDLVGSKEALFRVCVDRSAEQLAARIVAAVRAEDALRARLLAGSARFMPRSSGSAGAK